VRVLLSVQRAGFLKNFESVVRLLSDRGHDVEIVVSQPAAKVAGEDAMLAELRSLRGVSVEDAPRLEPDSRREAAAGLRDALDYFSFLDPAYPDAYRRMWEPRAARPARLIGRSVVGRSRFGRRALLRVLGATESATQPTEQLSRFLADRKPDVLLLTPYMLPGSAQPDLLRAAQASGIPAAVCVHSWDNLSSKGRIRTAPDRLFVWNEIQRREAEELHGIPPERIVVTGAQAFDRWFELSPRPRDDFCAKVGLDPERPFVLYACSAPWLGRAESDFLVRWIAAIRSTEEPLRSAGIMIRPHPKRYEELPAGLPGVVVWPPGPRLPAAAEERADYFDSLYHGAALVGVNTSAMIEAAILRRPVLTLSLPEFAEEQEQTVHFRYLLEVAGGVAQSSPSLDEHVARLRDALLSPSAAADRADAFTEAFVRPYGRDRPATPIFVDEIERLAAGGPMPRRRPGLASRAALKSGTAAYLAARSAWRWGKSAAGSG
jgi:hypothetical protein